MAVIIDKDAPVNREGQVGVLAAQVNGMPALEPLHILFLPLGEFLPASYRVIVIKEVGTVDKILEVAQRHVSILSIGIGGKHVATPTYRSLTIWAFCHCTFHRRFHPP